MERVALSKACSWIPEVSSLEEYERGAAGQTLGARRRLIRIWR